jgi:hypothetical protein
MKIVLLKEEWVANTTFKIDFARIVKRRSGKDISTVSFNYRKHLLIPWDIFLDRYGDICLLVNYFYHFFVWKKGEFLMNIHTGCRIRLINSVRYVVSNLGFEGCGHWEVSCAWTFRIAFVGAKSGSLKNKKMKRFEEEKIKRLSH